MYNVFEVGTEIVLCPLSVQSVIVTDSQTVLIPSRLKLKTGFKIQKNNLLEILKKLYFTEPLIGCFNALILVQIKISIGSRSFVMECTLCATL
jgi:hypothetical protein